jgi:hypothetical protein
LTTIATPSNSYGSDLVRLIVADAGPINLSGAGREHRCFANPI